MMILEGLLNSAIASTGEGWRKPLAGVTGMLTLATTALVAVAVYYRALRAERAELARIRRRSPMPLRISNGHFRGR